MSNIMYKTVSSTDSLPLIECTSKRHDSWVLRYDCKPFIVNEGTENENTMYEYLAQDFRHKPSIEEIRDAIHAQMNSETDEKIISGFSWNNKPVWLSTENQFNFKAAYDVALQTEGGNLPIKFKLGEDSEGNPVYHTFTSMNAFTDFYTRAIAYINQCLNEGWTRKDSFDFTPYEEALNPVTVEEEVSE